MQITHTKQNDKTQNFCKMCIKMGNFMLIASPTLKNGKQLTPFPARFCCLCTNDKALCEMYQ